MYENLTVEDVKSSIIERMNSDIDVREGSFTNDMLSAAAYEIWKVYQSLDAIIPIVYVDETSGEFIDKRCSEYGIKRKEGTKAIVNLTFTGTDGTVVPKGSIFLTTDGLEFLTDNSATITSGTAVISATAAEIGEKFNVAAGTIILQFVSLKGITNVTNTAANGGTSPESDTALVTRLYNFLRMPATSGNANHYKQWALEVPGIGDAKVFPLWDGPGTVKVVIVDNNKQPVSVSMLESTHEHIEKLRPIGAEINVVSGTGKQINLAAKVILAAGYSLQTIISALSQEVTGYFKSIAFSIPYISIAKIGTILLSTDGVIDYSDLQLNGTTSNIVLTEEEIPILGTVNLEV